MSQLPLRRNDVLSRRVGDDVVLFDRRSGRVHALDAQAAAIWEMCGGPVSMDAACQREGMTPAEVADALDALAAADVFESSGLSRRRLLQRGSLLGAGALVTTLAAPMASAHASTTAATPPYDPGSVDAGHLGTNADTSALGVYAASWEGVSFTAGRTGTLTQADLRIEREGDTRADLVIAIYSASNNLPATLLTSHTVGYASVYVNGDYPPLTVVFDAPPAVTKGTTYVIVAKSSEATSDNAYLWRTEAPGSHVYSSDSGGTWHVSGNAVTPDFQTYVRS